MAKGLICYDPVILLGLTAVSLPPFNQATSFRFLEASAILGTSMPGTSRMLVLLFSPLSVGTLLAVGISATPEQSPQDSR
jgi:hypothetical protein